MPNQKQVNWGIIGPGRIAQDFANDMQFASTARLKAVASRSLDRAQTFAQKYNIPRAYGSYEDMFEDDSIDIIYIAVPMLFIWRWPRVL